MNKEKIFNNLMEYLEKHNCYPEYYHGITEQGYDDKPLLVADWNIYYEDNGKKHISHKLLSWAEDYFEDIEFSWNDEWTNCSDCYKAVRTSPTHYGWLPSYMWTSDCSIACVECYEDQAEDIIETYRNDTNKAIMPEFYPILEQNGFICYSPDEYCKCFETGFHPGQNDDPKRVAKDIESELPNYDYIFKINSCGQFDLQWSVFLRKQETD